MQHLRDIPWERLSKAERLVHLASLVGADAAPMAPDVRSRLTIALSEMLEALAATGAERGARLESWIGRRLIARGPDVLLSDARRSAIFAMLRDRGRRVARARSGVHSTRIELPEASWAKLSRIRDQLGTMTISETLARMIDCYALSVAPRHPRRVRLARSDAGTPDLLLPLGAPSKPSGRPGDPPSGGGS